MGDVFYVRVFLMPQPSSVIYVVVIHSKTTNMNDIYYMNDIPFDKQFGINDFIKHEHEDDLFTKNDLGRLINFNNLGEDVIDAINERLGL